MMGTSHWVEVFKSKKFLTGTNIMEQTLNERESKMTKAISILMLSSFICWLPLPVLNLVFLTFSQNKTSDHYNESTISAYVLYVIIQSVFVSQFALNFFIYISRSEQFRDAFLDAIPQFQTKESTHFIQKRTISQNNSGVSKCKL